MKTIVIAYDGSDCSAAIFTELQHAGLPLQLDAHVVAVTESLAPAAIDPAMWAPAPTTLPAGPFAEAEKAEAMRRAGTLAEQGAARLKAVFPAWRVLATGLVGSAAHAIVQRAREVSADIIFIGSHSRTAVGRFFLGSVSQKVAAEAKCSVRICRPRPPSGAAPRLIVAVDGSLPSQAAVRTVAERAWRAATVVAAVVVIEPQLRAVIEVPPDLSIAFQRQRDATIDWLEAVATAAHRQLEIPGLVPERHTLEGEPKHTLLEWAERWNADCLFVGASGLQHPDTTTLGTVASALAARARCSVEIVRR